MLRLLGLLFAGCVLTYCNVLIAADPAAKPLPAPPRLNALPVEHAYQKALRDYLATLKATDFDHGVTAKFDASYEPTDLEEQYRYYLSTLLLQPLVGTKRGAPAVNAPSRLFTLAEIETPEGVKRPPVWVEPIAQLVTWKHPGNPYYQSKAMKLRAFAVMTINLVMQDEQLEHAPELGGSRSDWLSPSLLAMAFPYQYVSDVVPEPARAAYRAGLEKMGRRILAWGPKEEEPNIDVVATVALWYVSQAVGDAKFSDEVKEYCRRYFTDPRYFHPAGYFVDRGGVDLGFSGQTNFFASWLALASQWPFAIEAVEKIHRLRAHVCLPQPDGKTVLGPSQYHNRYSADAWKDQWEWGAMRDTAASLVTQEAAYLVKSLPADVLVGAARQRAQQWNFQINENPINTVEKRFQTNDEIRSSPWKFGLWPSYNFPATVNYAVVHYPDGAYARRKKLEETNSPLLKSPYERGENFVREFAGAFFATRTPTYAAVLHTGPVGKHVPESSLALLPGPYGFGGGQLSAFWTSQTGSVLLGRRGGMSWDKNFDLVEDWRKWPIHAVSGARVDGKHFTTARITHPKVTSEIKGNQGTVQVSGVVPRAMLDQTKSLEGRLEYDRKFTIAPDALRVETTLHTTGQDNFAELFESLPVLIREAPPAPKATDTPTTVELKRGNGPWTTASVEWTDGVTAVRLARFGGAVLIEFDRPRRVMLGEEWSDKYLSKVQCRNLLIDLIEKNGQPAVVTSASVSYKVRAE